MTIDDTPAKAKPEPAPTTSDSSAQSGGAPANYSRGEGQKAVTQAYRDNWNAIFGNNKPTRSRSMRERPSVKPAAKTKSAATRRTTLANGKQKSGR
jgi:hypothetical protein